MPSKRNFRDIILFRWHHHQYISNISRILLRKKPLEPKIKTTQDLAGLRLRSLMHDSILVKSALKTRLIRKAEREINK
uniref:Uncharacterized protein n=1 Tax=Candidatus Kentrum sp. MB TaxID=2138164 RepID=A0A450XJ41_9GAMM|nr:MAG: hypothetical protein BECKMB1821G_GA0114241_10488 [Candidatus Kentron sp. MB]VFK33505.1 MAG: hypothetical protein BECKMB1821I_GA0114274_10478 [Candidatus Kentron sp. MB]